MTIDARTARPGTRSARRWVATTASALAAVVAAATVQVGATAVTAAPASAATVASTATASADALPTTQVDGVVWAQLIVGDRVYVTGEFTSARPAGSPAGQDEVARANLLAYDITTGELVASFAPALNAAGYALAASPDGSRLYVAGSFTTAGGRTVNRVAAIDTATGAVDPAFRPRFDSRVRALALHDGVLYAGGIFSSVGGTARSRLAAVDATTGALLPWAPTTDAEVMAAVVTPASGQLVVAGRFSALNGTQRLGSGALDLATGATRPWAASSTVTAYGPKAAVYSLSTDGTTVYGTGYNYYGTGNLEGTFAATADGGGLVWASGCRGDTYSNAVANGVLYSVGHAHDCSMNGGNPETSPRSYQHAKAFSAAWNGARNTGGVYNGLPGPDYLHWLPTLEAGTYTGQSQAAWSVVADSRYVVLGGEFPGVNGTPQQGLVRFAVRSAAPRQQGPQGVSSTDLTAADTGDGSLRLTWPAAWDRDDASLTYEVLRGPASSATVVATTTAASSWWDRPVLSAVVPSSSTAPALYRVRVTDADGNTATGPALTAATSTAAVRSPYRDAVLADGAQSFWRLGEASGTVGADRAGSNDLALATSATRGTAGATTDGDLATTFPGTATVPAVASARLTAPSTFTTEAWFRTTSTTGGKVVGFGSSATAASGSYDRHVYLRGDGRLTFGVYNSAARTVTSPLRYNDGKWHQVTATFGAAGMVLYVDGAQVAADASVTTASSYAGYWRVAGDRVSGWPTAPSTPSLNGAVDDVAVYPTALSAARVAEHHRLATSATGTPPVAKVTATTAGLTATLDGSGSTDAETSVTGWAWQFGDGTTGTGAVATHTYAAAGTYTVELTATDEEGRTSTASTSVVVAAPTGPVVAARDAFTRTTTTGWGAADAGGAWTTTGGTTSVADGAGRVVVKAGQTSTALLSGVSAADTDLTATVSASTATTGGGAFLTAVARRTAQGDYRVRAKLLPTGAVALSTSAVVGGVETALGSTTVSGLVVAPGQQLEVRLQVTGTAPTTVSARAWLAGTAEPTAWQLTATDASAALQAPGAVGLVTYLSGSATAPVTVSWDDLAVVTAG